VLCVAAVLHLLDVWRSRSNGAAMNGALLVASAVFLQAALGITTLLQHAPISLSLLHQGMAIILLTAAVWHAQRLTSRQFV
jgi:heme a synthase